MKIIKNSIIPFRGYKAINLFGILFVREDAVIGSVTLNHEAIHTAQMRELLYVPFYAWYIIEFLLRLAYVRSWSVAYRGVLFEREAYSHEGDMGYLKGRRRYAWLCHR